MLITNIWFIWSAGQRLRRNRLLPVLSGFLDLKCQRCPIDDIGVLVFHVMVDCCRMVVKSFPIFTDEFISKFKFISVQLVCDVIYSLCLLDHLSYFLL